MVISREDRMGVRALGRFADRYRAKFCPVGREVDPAKKVNEPWRRISNMTIENESLMDRKERRAGLRALVEWIGNFTHDDSRLTIRAAMGLVRAEKEFSPDGEWACEGQSRELVVQICQELNISKHKLGELTREYRGIGATELIDGFRVKGVKNALAERLKIHARELWLAAGDYVGVMIMDGRLKVYGGGKSEYFVDPAEDYYRKEYSQIRQERQAELIAAFDAGWARGDFSRDGFAMGLGFRSFRELNRACLNVYGKTVRQLAWDIGDHIIEFYLAKEWEALRVLALCECRTAGIARARYLYHGSTARPTGPTSEVSLLWGALEPTRREGMDAWLRMG